MAVAMTSAGPESGLRRQRMLVGGEWVEAGWVQVNQGLGQVPGHTYGGFKQSGIGREFSLEGMLDGFTQRKNVTVNLEAPSRADRPGS
jgi:acyl-CoA reductase-like NAD-dependent aldehyde dehydrogenase